jgi:DNA polymerase family B
VKFAAFGALWSDYDGRWQGAGYCDLTGHHYALTRGDLVALLTRAATEGYTLLAQDAERHIVDVLWPAGEDVTVHSYEQVFNRGLWKMGKRIRAEIWESRNLAAGLNIQAIAKGIGFPLRAKPYVLDDGLDSRQRRWQCTVHNRWECLECYAIDRVETLYRFASSLAEWSSDLGIKMKRTLGGNAVALWQHFDAGKSQTLKGKLVLEMARAAYHGGRCECFQVGDLTDIYTYDISRHYAAVMLNDPMPDLHGLTYVEKPKPLDLDGMHGTIEATINVPSTNTPVLPAIGPDNQLYFPVGTFSGTFIIEEIRQAVLRGATILSVERIAYTRKSLNPFSTFIYVMSDLRSEWERQLNPLAIWAKMLPNGLYGRLGVRELQAYRTYHRSQTPLAPKDIDGKDVIWIGNMRFVIADYQVRMQSKIQNVLWAATITAYGRLRLLRHLEAAGASLVYCDTDSIFSTAPLQSEPPEVGALRDTGHFRRGTILGPKLYRLEAGDTPDMVAARGIPKQLALEFMNAGKVEIPQPYTLAVSVDQLRKPGQWATAIRNHRNVVLKRQPDAIRVPGDTSYHSFTRPVVFGPDVSLAGVNFEPERTAR